MGDGPLLPGKRGDYALLSTRGEPPTYNMMHIYHLLAQMDSNLRIDQRLQRIRTAGDRLLLADTDAAAYKESVVRFIKDVYDYLGIETQMKSLNDLPPEHSHEAEQEGNGDVRENNSTASSDASSSPAGVSLGDSEVDS